MTSTQRHRISLFLKIAFVFALFYFLFKRGFISVHDTGRALTEWQYIIPAFLFFCVSASLGVIRWQWLLQAQGIHLSWLRVFQLTFIGNFFNIALPGAVSGDFVKAFYVGKELPGKRARSFGAILFDRIAGLSALICVSAGALLLSSTGASMFAPIVFTIYLAASGFVFFYGYLFLVREHHDPILKILKLLESRFPKAQSLTQIYEGARHYHNHRWVVLKVIGISVLIQLLVGFGISKFALALGITGIPLISILVVVPLGLLVTALPVLPAGLGTGHAAFLYLFKLLGTDRGADIFTLTALTNLIVGGIGGIIYLQFRSHAESPTFSPLESDTAGLS